MPGIGFPEMLFILVAALLLFGPRRLPEIGRTLGKGLAEFRKAANELKRSLDAEGLEKDLRETRETIASVDPRRYLKEVMQVDEQAGRVARGAAGDEASDEAGDEAEDEAGAEAEKERTRPGADAGANAGADESEQAGDASPANPSPAADAGDGTDQAAGKVVTEP